MAGSLNLSQSGNDTPRDTFKQEQESDSTGMNIDGGSKTGDHSNNSNLTAMVTDTRKRKLQFPTMASFKHQQWMQEVCVDLLPSDIYEQACGFDPLPPLYEFLDTSASTSVDLTHYIMYRAYGIQPAENLASVSVDPNLETIYRSFAPRCPDQHASPSVGLDSQVPLAPSPG